MVEVDSFILIEDEEDFDAVITLADQLGYSTWFKTNDAPLTRNLNYYRTNFFASNDRIIALTANKEVGSYSSWSASIDYPHHQIFSCKEFINLFKEKDMSLVSKWKEIGLKEPKKTFRQIGITGKDDMPTDEGVRIFVAWMLADKETGNKFYEDVAKPIREEEEKEEE